MLLCNLILLQMISNKRKNEGGFNNPSKKIKSSDKFELQDENNDSTGIDDKEINDLSSRLESSVKISRRKNFSFPCGMPNTLSSNDPVNRSFSVGTNICSKRYDNNNSTIRTIVLAPPVLQAKTVDKISLDCAIEF